MLVVETKTELHTHFTGMLSTEGFMNLLESLDYSFPLGFNSQFDFVNSMPVSS